MSRLRPYLPLAGLVVLVAIYTLSQPSRLSLDLLNTILIFATFATAWNIAGGMTGLFSLGHSALFAIGAFGTTLLRLRLGVPTLPAIMIAALVAVLVALFIGAISLRLRGHYFALATLGLAAIMYIALQNLSDVTGGDEGIVIPKDASPTELIFQTKGEYVWVTLGLYVITALVVITLSNSKRGYEMLAVKEDEVSARSIGIPAVRVKMFAVGLSGFFSALAGAVFAQYTLYITPANVGSVALTWEAPLMAIIGGMGGVFGPLLGAAVIVLLEHGAVEAVGSSVPGLSNLLYGALLIVCILILPDGVVGILRTIKDAVIRLFVKPRSPESHPPTSIVATTQDEPVHAEEEVKPR